MKASDPVIKRTTVRTKPTCKGCDRPLRNWKHGLCAACFKSKKKRTTKAGISPRQVKRAVLENPDMFTPTTKVVSSKRSPK